MRQRTRLVVNSLSNVLARVVTVATRFLIVPFAVGVLGRPHYGTWIVVGQIFAYTRILDMGLRSAISREVAFGLAREESDRLSRSVNTAAGYYAAAGLLIVLVAVTVSFFFPDWFDVPPEHRSAARMMVLISGVALALTVPQNAYSAVVSGLQRYDVIAGTGVLADILRLVLIIGFLRMLDVGQGWMLLAVATSGTLLCAACVRTAVALRLCPSVRFEPWRVERSRLGGLLLFGVSSVVYMMSITVGMQLAQILIGVFMSTAEAADLNVAGMFVLAAHSFVLALGISARVVASRYDGEGDEKMLRHLLMRSTRYSGFVVLAGIIALALFSDALFRLWIGGQYRGADAVAALETVVRACRVLLVGYGLFWLMMPAYNVINGMGRHHAAAVMALVSGVVSMVLVAVLALSEGATVDRVAWGIVLPMIPIWSVLLPWYCCRQTGQPIGAYVWEGFAIPFLCCVPAVVLGLLWVRFSPAASWSSLIGQMLTCAAVLAPPAWFVVLKADDRAPLTASAKALCRRVVAR